MRHSMVFATLMPFVGEEEEDDQATGKKKVISIPLRFKPIETPRGPRRGGSGGPGNAGGRYHDRPYRDDQQQQRT